jgi:hypothetical protein
MDEMCDAVIDDHLLELHEIRDVALHERQPCELFPRRDRLQPPRVLAEVVGDHGDALANELSAGPGTDAAERAGDEETFGAHAVPERLAVARPLVLSLCSPIRATRPVRSNTACSSGLLETVHAGCRFAEDARSFVVAQCVDDE